MVPQLSLLHEVRQSDALSWQFAAPPSAWEVETRGGALPRHPRERTARREGRGELDPPSCEAAGLGAVGAVLEGRPLTTAIVTVTTDNFASALSQHANGATRAKRRTAAAYYLRQV